MKITASKQIYEEKNSKKYLHNTIIYIIYIILYIHTHIENQIDVARGGERVRENDVLTKCNYRICIFLLICSDTNYEAHNLCNQTVIKIKMINCNWEITENVQIILRLSLASEILVSFEISYTFDALL